MNIYEVAKRAGVSIATVSRVINNSPSVRQETRARVQSVLAELNYMPNAIARSLAVNATHTIGVLASDVRDSYYANAIYIIEQELRGLGYNVILCNTGGELDKKKRYLQVLLEKKVDGIILVGSVFKEKTGNKHILDTAEKVPVIMLNSHVEGENIFSVVCDDYYGTSQIVSELVHRGHRDIVYIYDVESFSGLAKLEGFKNGMAAAGYTIEPWTINRTTSGLSGGVAAVEHLESLGKPYTAIVASEDILAAGILKHLSALNISIPEKKVIFGYNNSQISMCTSPELSTVDNKVAALAKGAAKLLHDVLQSQAVSLKTVILPELVFRESCL